MGLGSGAQLLEESAAARRALKSWARTGRGPGGREAEAAEEEGGAGGGLAGVRGDPRLTHCGACLRGGWDLETKGFSGVGPAGWAWGGGIGNHSGFSPDGLWQLFVVLLT